MPRPGSADEFARFVSAMVYARERIYDGDPDAIRSVVRLARALVERATVSERFDVVQAAEALATHASGACITELEHLLAELRRAIGVQAPGVDMLVVSSDRQQASLVAMTCGVYCRDHIVARTVDDALEHIAARSFGLIVVDVALAAGDGRDLLAKVGGDPSLRSVPVLALVEPSAPVWVRAECLALGAREVYPKPVDPVGLRNAVSVLAGHEDRSSLMWLDPAGDAVLDGAQLRESVRARVRQAHLTGRRWTALCIHWAQSGPTRAEVTAVVAAIHTLVQDVGRATAFVDDAVWVVLEDTDLDEATQTAAVLQATLSPRWAIGVGGGTCTDVTWEALREAVVRGARLAAAVGEPLVSVLEPRKRHGDLVLVVDDDPVVAALARAGLERHGFRMAHEEDGTQLLAVVRRLRPVAIVLDIGLPHVDGLELLRQLKDEAHTRHIPVVLLTASTSARFELGALRAGAADFVPKPFDTMVLAARVRQQVDRGSE